jgi:ribosome-binding protein aMBF1 (putative translation factor)
VVNRSNVTTTSNGELVREEREDREWSRELLAVLADCSYATIARFEVEPDYTPSDEILERIYRALGIDP